MSTTVSGDIRVGTLEELKEQECVVVTGEGRTIAVFYHNDNVYAVDNRCPHMGFPLSHGTVKDGILTCHWHHAKFDLAGGCTFDPFADDITSFKVKIQDGSVWVNPTPLEEDRYTHWRRKFDEGLEQNIRLVEAKSVVGLNEVGTTKEILARAALFGLRNRASGWSSGHSILTAMANILPHLEEADRPLALYHGVTEVARDTAGQPPNFDIDPLDTLEMRPERYRDWYRRFVEMRSSDAAARTLRTAIHIGLPRSTIADMVFTACTDHLFRGVGHSLDFANKAFELLDHIGWDHAEDVLPSLIPDDKLVNAQRMEESPSWTHPVDLPALLFEVFDDLDDLIEQGGGRWVDWSGHLELGETILEARPQETLEAMTRLVRDGAPLTELAATVAYAAARRPVHFRVTNEFSDWNTVHHTFTYTNAVDQAMRRAPSNLLARAIFDGAMSVYLERFLNVPKQPIPEPSGRGASKEALLESFDRQGAVDETGQIVMDMVDQGQGGEVVRTLGHALLREDAGFHMFQVYEAGVRQYHHFKGKPMGAHILTGTARFLSAHSPTVRSRTQIYDVAVRLMRGEALHEDAA